MDAITEYDIFLSSMENFNINVASEMLSKTSFNFNAGDVIEQLGKGLTEDNFKKRPDYFNFCEEQLFKMANNEEYQEFIFDFLDIIEMYDSKLSSSVLIVVTVLENTENPNLISLEYLMISTFNILDKMDIINLKENLLNIVQLLLKLKKHFQHEQSILHYFARFAFLVIRANIDPIEYLNLLSNIIYDPFYLLEIEFDKKEEELYIASFFYLYFKTGMQWGPKIYNHFYVLYKCSNLALSVFDHDTFGKSFTELMLTKFKNNEIPLHLLNKHHEYFISVATYSSVYVEDYDVRKISLELLMIFLDKLSTDAQYVVLKHAFLKPLESAVKDQLIVKMKNIIILKLKSNHVLGCFQGIRLLELVQLCCNIPDTHGFYIESNKEHILGAISLLFFLSIYKNEKLNMDNMDKEFSNHTKQFLNKIQNLINKAHEQHTFEEQVLDSKIVVEETKLQVNDENYAKLSKNGKRDILAQVYRNIILVQTRLDMLKNCIKD